MCFYFSLFLLIQTHIIVYSTVASVDRDQTQHSRAEEGKYSYDIDKRFYPHAHSSSYVYLLFSQCSGFGGFGGGNKNNQSGNTGSTFGSGSGSTFGSGNTGSTFGSGNTGSTFGSGNNNNNMQQGGSQKQSFTNSFLGGFCGALLGNMILTLLHIK